MGRQWFPFFQVIGVPFPPCSQWSPTCSQNSQCFLTGFAMKFLTCSPKLLMCSTRCSQIAPHCISCLFPKFELSYKYINYSKSISLCFCFGECPMLQKRIVVIGQSKKCSRRKAQERGRDGGMIRWGKLNEIAN